MKSGILHEVLTAYGAVGVDVAEMLHKSDYCKRHQHEYGGNELASVNVAQAFFSPEAPDFSRLLENNYVARKLSAEGNKTDTCGVNVSDDKAEQNRYDLKKAFGLGISVEAYNSKRRYDCRRPLLPALAAAVKAYFEIVAENIVPEHFGRQNHTDEYDYRTYDDRGEKLFDFFNAHEFDNKRQDNIHEPRAYQGYHDARHRLVPFRRTDVAYDYSAKSRQESKARAQKYRNLFLCEKIKDDCSYSCRQKRDRNAHARKYRDEYGCAEHGKHVLEA